MIAFSSRIDRCDIGRFVLFTGLPVTSAAPVRSFRASPRPASLD